MLPRNTAGQAFLVPGALLNVADGSPVTEGAAILLDDGDAGVAGAGTLAHFRGGVHRYTPTQAEMDRGIVSGVLYKAGASDVPFNLVTTRFPVQAAGVLPDVAAGEDGGLVRVTDMTPDTAIGEIVASTPVGIKDGGIRSTSYADGAEVPLPAAAPDGYGGLDPAGVQAACATAIASTTARLPAAPAGYGGASPSETASAVLSAVVQPGETLQQALARIRAALLGQVDVTTVPGTAIYRNKDGSEAFRATYSPSAGRAAATLPGA